MSDGSQNPINPLLIVPGSPGPSAASQQTSLVARKQRERRTSRLFSNIPSISPTATRTTFPIPALPYITETPVRGTFSVPTRTAAASTRPIQPTTQPTTGQPSGQPDDGSEGEADDGEGEQHSPSGGGFPGDEPSDPPGGGPPGPPGGGPPGGGSIGERPESPSNRDFAMGILQGINSLTGAIANLSNPPPARSSRSNLRNPDTFDGSDPMKLRPFLAQCYLHFAEREHDFTTDDDKIIYMMSFLRGTALDWFEPQMFDPDPNTVPAWDNNFPLFLQELQDTFGPDDPVGEAEDQLRNLRMQHGDHISTYVVSFNRLAAYTGWGMAALRYQFYEGLPRRIKDNLVHVDYPNTLVGVRNAAQRVDTRYWKREGEKKREASGKADKPSDPTSNKASSGSSGNKSGDKSSGKSAKGKKSNQSTQSNNASASTSTGKSDTTPKATPKPYADKLDKNGQITATERARRVKLNLCMYCGGSGHKASECRKRPASAQGNAATTSASIKEIDTAAESKK
jgi:hypothetical protein